MMKTVLSAALMSAALVSAGTADARTIFTGANGYTIDESGRLQRFSTLIVGDDGRIEGTRSGNGDLPKGNVVDLKGKTLLPGLIDAHTHIMGLGAQMLSLDLTETESLEEAVSAIGAYAEENPDLQWITGGGWNQVIWGLDRFPNAADLDPVVADRPVMLSRVDGHAAWLNSAALKAAGITAKTEDPDGGRIERDDAGNPTGLLVDAAVGLADAKVPAPTQAQLDAQLTAALRAMAATGMTGAADMGTTPEAWATFESFAEAGKLTARIGAYGRPYASFTAIAGHEQPGWQYDDHLALSGLKLVVDGALGSRGAAMLEPYSDAPEETGLTIIDGAKLRNQMVGAASQGYQIAVHAIGDAANREALDAFTDLSDYMPAGRNRVEHAQIVSKDDLPRFAELGLIASIQPTHATSDKAMAEDRIGPQRIEGGYAWHSIAETGTRLALGSDFPVEPVNPFYGLHAAVTRQDREGMPPGGWYPEEALSPAQALAGFTAGAAYAMKLDRAAGTLTPGKWADFVIVDGDPIEGPPGDIWTIEVLETWVGGEQVYAAD
ncbi:amidohydrolase [Pacificimonas flava]|uniref:Amidohydrolase 3 domain-containing protein n=1 Tax=Pacificimonas flava TaxID=1234595 RepID=M2U2I9_9SPHN|nr:amidohydrolase [Pacificimonas flava]EMD82043.1 hypothetical protein C725_2531 [Pacificimonas flava]MBB5280884.1 hypothetical protein [Pacificimonas flava]